MPGRMGSQVAAASGGVITSTHCTGSGIAADQLPHIFERFHRIEEPRARTHEGTGIGLALVRELVALHGGVVSVRSTPGLGSVFEVKHDVLRLLLHGKPHAGARVGGGRGGPLRRILEVCPRPVASRHWLHRFRCHSGSCSPRCPC